MVRFRYFLLRDLFRTEMEVTSTLMWKAKSKKGFIIAINKCGKTKHPRNNIESLNS